MSWWAKPGVKCVCLAEEWAVDGEGAVVAGPELNAICIVASWPIESNGEVGIRLVGWDGDDDIFQLEYFRPLITKTQEDDVELFRHLLDGIPVGEPA